MLRSRNNRAPVAIIGIGNYLLSDEGAGIHAVEKLREMPVPGYADVIDGATAGAGLRFFIENRKRVIFIDAGEFGGEPGEYIRFEPDEFQTSKKLDNISLHEFDLLAYLKQHSSEPSFPDNITIYCIQPASIEPGDQLSPEVERGISEITRAVVLDIQNR